MPNRLLIIDDEPQFGQFVERVGQNSGFEVKLTSRADAFKEAFSQWQPTAIVLDLVIPDIDGIELLRWLISENCRATIIILSGFDARILDAARRVGRERGLKIAAALSKPVRAEELKEKLKTLLNPEEMNLTPDDLENALKEGELFLFYQPKVSLHSGLPSGAEALMRWLHPVHGAVASDKMGGLIESSPLLAEMVSEFALREALKQQKHWAEAGLDITMSINMSASSLRDEALADRIEAICQLQGGVPDKVMIEITETTAMGHELEALDILSRLRLKGFKLSIDDFGAGFSSLGRLRHIPATEIKIDRSFVSEAPVSPAALAIVKTAIGLAHDLGLSCVAEGIETAKHYRMMVELGCDVGQGYGIARPLSGEQVLAWKDTWQPLWQKPRGFSIKREEVAHSSGK